MTEIEATTENRGPADEPVAWAGAFTTFVGSCTLLATVLGADPEVVAASAGVVTSGVGLYTAVFLRRKVTPYKPLEHPEAMADPDDPDIG